jgi:hypothetical protein
VYSNFIHAYGYGVGVFDDCDAYSGGVFGYWYAWLRESH